MEWYAELDRIGLEQLTRAFFGLIQLKVQYITSSSRHSYPEGLIMKEKISVSTWALWEVVPDQVFNISWHTYCMLQRHRGTSGAWVCTCTLTLFEDERFMVSCFSDPVPGHQHLFCFFNENGSFLSFCVSPLCLWRPQRSHPGANSMDRKIQRTVFLAVPTRDIH